MGLAEAAASLPGHEPGHLHNSAGQQVKQSPRLLNAFVDSGGKYVRVFVFFFLMMILTGVIVFQRDVPAEAGAASVPHKMRRSRGNRTESFNPLADLTMSAPVIWDHFDYSVLQPRFKLPLCSKLL